MVSHVYLYRFRSNEVFTQNEQVNFLEVTILENIYFSGAFVVVAFTLGYLGVPIFIWTAFAAGVMYFLKVPTNVWYGFAAVAFVFNLKPVRAFIVSSLIMKAMKALKLVPKISDTEKAALNAGSVWIEADFFSGKPDFKKISTELYPKLTEEEQAYLDGPINDLCKLIDDWTINQDKEIPKEVWEFMKKIKIFGMIIPKKYGGLEFSALAHSEVILKLASRSIAVTITAMVPNSLGPAELLNHFGTDEEKDRWLPRLATGEEIPCFALTEQRAGSDAGSLESQGVIFKKGDELYLRLNWNKRWITLAGVSTVLGLAFQLRDPDKLLGDEYDLGITCALIPSNTKGISKQFRHDPLSAPFYNCPIQGVNVEVPISCIIGGVKNAGQGWKMLMECLGAGRGISLPSQAVGGAKLIARVTSAHSSIRKQFGIPLCKLEGLEEPLARIGGYTYLLDSMRLFTLGALDRGISPSVITATAKLNSTEISRKLLNDGMDIMAGAGISRGPRNLISSLYTTAPIGITVEGANILTRTLIIFGQGIMRAHPWAFKEVEAIEQNSRKDFDVAIWGHVGHIVRNVFRFIFLSLTRGCFALTPGKKGTRRFYQKLNWASANFALLTDIAMGSLGGKLKFKEMLTGRFADIISWLYICSSVLRRYEAEGFKSEDYPFVRFSMNHGLYEIQKAFDGIYANLQVPGLTWFFKYVVRNFFNLNAIERDISDKVKKAAAKSLLKHGEGRDRLTQGIYYPKSREEALGRYEYVFDLVKRAETVEAKITKAIRKKQLPKKRIFKLIDLALEKNIIDKSEFDILHETANARWDACQVDCFSEEGFHGVEESDNKVFKNEYKGPAGAPSSYVGSPKFEEYKKDT